MNLDQARAALEQERQEIVHTLAGLERTFNDIVEAARDSNLDDEHDVEGETIAVSRAQVDSYIHANRLRLKAIYAAMARIDDGRYGTCLGCGIPIGVARLQARPSTPWCIECSRTQGP